MRTTSTPSMVKVRVKVVGSDRPGEEFRVDLPTYMMVPGSEEYADAEKKVLKTVEVLIPADECDDKGQPDKAKIRAKYKGQAKWDRDDVLGDV